MEREVREEFRRVAPLTKSTSLQAKPYSSGRLLVFEAAKAVLTDTRNRRAEQVADESLKAVAIFGGDDWTDKD
jgi:hypothetical protein